MALSAVFALLDKYGAYRTFERLDPPGPAGSASAKSMKRRSAESAVMGEVSQEDVQIYVRHSSLSTAGFPVPPVKGDRVKDGTQTHTVKNVEEMHDDTGAVGAYRLWCRGL